MTLIQLALWGAVFALLPLVYYAPEILGFIRRRHEARMPRVMD
jgi:hypothetical protein